MESITLILEIAVAVLLACVVITAIYVHFRNSVTEVKQTATEIVDTTSKFDSVMLKQYDNTILKGYDVRYAVSQYGTSKPSECYNSGSMPNLISRDDFFVLIKFTQGTDIQRSIIYWNKDLIIPNKSHDLDDGEIKHAPDDRPYMNPYYVSPESKFKSYWLVHASDANEAYLRRFSVKKVESQDVDYEDIVGLYFEEIE